LRKKETGVESTDIHQKGIIKFCLDVALLFLEVLTKKNEKYICIPDELKAAISLLFIATLKPTRCLINEQTEMR